MPDLFSREPLYAIVGARFSGFSGLCSAGTRGTWGGRRFTHHQFGRDLNDLRVRIVSRDPLQKNVGGEHPHLRERLTDRRESRRLEGRCHDVVEANK